MVPECKTCHYVMGCKKKWITNTGKCPDWVRRDCQGQLSGWT